MGIMLSSILFVFEYLLDMAIDRLECFRMMEYCMLIKECFHNPNLNVALGKIPEPLLFQGFPSTKEDIQKNCHHDIANLTVEKV